MESIRNVINVHENYWDCFKYSILNPGNSQEIHYDFFEEKPTIYQTRNMYPEVDTTSLDIILDNIIKGKQCSEFKFKNTNKINY